MRSGGLGLGLGVGGGGVGYILNDSFTNAVAAGQFGVSPNELAVPGPGTRVVVDGAGAGTLFLLSGKLNCDGGAASVYGDPGYYLDQLDRVTGRMMVFHHNSDGNVNKIGFSAAQAHSNFITAHHVWINSNIIYASLAANRINLYTNATDYYYAIILKGTGCYIFSKTTTGLWYLMAITNTGTTDPVYPAIMNYSSDFTTDFIRVPQMLWTPRPISADAFTDTWPTTDGGGLTGLEAGGIGKTWTTAVGATWSNAGGFAVNAPVVGVEKFATADFSADADWTKEAGWAIGGGVATGTATSGYIYQSDVTSANRWIRQQVDLKTITAGSICLYLGGGTSSSAVNVPTDNIVATAKCVSGNSGVRGLSGFSGTIDNASVKLLTTTELIQVIDNGVEDFYAEIDVTMALGFQAGIVFNYVDALNFEIVYLNRNDAKIYWDKCVAGTYTTIGTPAAFIYAAGTKLAVRKIGTAVYFWYNNIYNAAGTSTSGLAGEKQGLFSTGNGATEVKFANWKLYAVGSGGEYSLLDMFCNDQIFPFRSTWKTDNAGTSNADQITLPLEATGTYNFYVNWGDGSAVDNITVWNQAEITHTFAGGAGTYTVTIWGRIQGWRFNDSNDKLKILSILSWGPLRLGNSDGYFYGCANLTIPATDTLDMTGTTTLSNAFWSCAAITTFPSLATLDTSQVTDISFMFVGCSNFNYSVSNFDTANVTTMYNVFNGCSLFNQSVSNFNTAKVITMNSMFRGCTAFNQSLAHFDTSKVTDTQSMFNGCIAFNQDISGWDVRLVTTMDSMFLNANALSTANYDALLIAWAAQAVKDSVAFHAGDAKYTPGGAAEAGRAHLAAAVLDGGHAWTITDGGAV